MTAHSSDFCRSLPIRPIQHIMLPKDVFLYTECIVAFTARKVLAVQDGNNKNAMQKPESVLIVCLIALVLFTVMFIAQRVDTNTKNSQLITLKSISEKITVNMRDYFNNQWSVLDAADRYLQSSEYKTAENALVSVGAAETFSGLKSGESMMLLIDDKGYYYTARSGKETLWNRSDRLDDTRAIFITSLAEIKDNIEEYICFCKKLDRPIETQEGVRFTHLIMAVDEKAFDIDLSLSEFGHITDAFVIRSNGRKINAQTENTDLAKAYNLIDALANAQCLMGNSYAEIKERIGAGQSGSALIAFKGDTYFMAFHPMEISDWYAVFIVNSRSMTSDVKPLIYHLVGVTAAGSIVMISLIVALLLLRRKQELKLEKMTRDQLRSAALAADRANEAKTAFLSRMSHDIRTPINGIIGMTAIAASRIEDRTAVESCLKKISVASDHLLELVNEVLDISRIESGKVAAENAPFDLLDMLCSVSDILESRISAKRLRYRTDFQELSESRIDGSKNLLKQILINILGNAVKYSGEGGTVFFKVYHEKPEQAFARYHFVVEGTGIGISPAYMEHIFDRFSQEKITARTNYEGTDLGLSIVKELTDLMGGEIHVSSRVGVGSVFEVVIPFALAAEETGAPPNETTVHHAGEFHVILAEDNAINREISEFLLAGSNITCVSVENGRLAVEAFANSAPGEFDAILMDVMMPELDGLEAARRIRAMERSDARTIPIFAITANAYREDMEKCLEAGMNAHLTKPLQMDRILDAMNRFCK